MSFFFFNQLKKGCLCFKLTNDIHYHKEASLGWCVTSGLKYADRDTVPYEKGKSATRRKKSVFGFYKSTSKVLYTSAHDHDNLTSRFVNVYVIIFSPYNAIFHADLAKKNWNIPATRETVSIRSQVGAN